jgi:hypothetical protein
MADDSSTNTDTANSSINQPTKASLDKFSKEEVQFLKDRLPQYIAANNEGPSKKGDKGDWVSQNIIPAFKDFLDIARMYQTVLAWTHWSRCFWYRLPVPLLLIIVCIEGEALVYKPWQAWS